MEGKEECGRRSGERRGVGAWLRETECAEETLFASEGDWMDETESERDAESDGASDGVAISVELQGETGVPSMFCGLDVVDGEEKEVLFVLAEDVCVGVDASVSECGVSDASESPQMSFLFSFSLFSVVCLCD